MPHMLAHTKKWKNKRSRFKSKQSSRQEQGQESDSRNDIRRCLDGLVRERTSRARLRCLTQLKEAVERYRYIENILDKTDTRHAHTAPNIGCVNISQEDRIVGIKEMSLLLKEIMEGALGGKQGLRNLPGYTVHDKADGNRRYAI